MGTAVVLPLHKFIGRTIKNRRLADGVPADLVAALVITTFVFIAREVNHEARRVAETARREIAGGEWGEPDRAMPARRLRF